MRDDGEREPEGDPGGHGQEREQRRWSSGCRGSPATSGRPCTGRSRRSASAARGTGVLEEAEIEVLEQREEDEDAEDHQRRQRASRTRARLAPGAHASPARAARRRVGVQGAGASTVAVMRRPDRRRRVEHVEIGSATRSHRLPRRARRRRAAAGRSRAGRPRAGTRRGARGRATRPPRPSPDAARSRSELQVLGSYADHDVRRATVRARRPRSRRGGASGRRRARRRGTSPSLVTRPATVFIGGLPMNRATKRFAGRA